MQATTAMFRQRAAEPTLQQGQSRHAWRRVLVFRSCRMPQFAAAVSSVRAMSPHAEICALTQPEFADAVRQAGADRVCAHTASRLGPRTLGLRQLRTLRALACDAIVIPTMAHTLAGAENLLRLAAVIGAPEVLLAPGGRPADLVSRSRITSLAIVRTFAIPEPVVVLGQMLRALVTRRAPRQAQAGRTRVLHIINSLGLGGAQRQCAELVNRTPRDRYQVSVLVLADDSDFSRTRFTRPDVDVEYLRPGLGTGTPVDAIADVCRRGQYDIVHTWLPLPNFYGSAAARLAGVPRIVTAIRSFNPGHFPQWCQWWFRPADALAARLATTVTVNATPLVRDYARWTWLSPRRIRVVHNGLDAAALAAAAAGSGVSLVDELGIAPGVPLVGVVGRLSEEKGQAVFLRIVAAAHAAGRASHAVIIGDGPCEGELRQLARELGIEASVSFLGARQDVARLMGALDVLILSSRREGFPNVILEAAFLGVPVLATAVGGVLDIITDAASLFPVADVQAGADALVRLLADPPGTRERAGRLRQRCLERFTSERMVAAWLDLYESPDRDPRRRACAQPDAMAWCTVAEGDR